MKQFLTIAYLLAGSLLLNACNKYGSLRTLMNPAEDLSGLFTDSTFTNPF